MNEINSHDELISILLIIDIKQIFYTYSIVLPSRLRYRNDK